MANFDLRSSGRLSPREYSRFDAAMKMYRNLYRCREELHMEPKWFYACSKCGTVKNIQNSHHCHKQGNREVFCGYWNAQTHDWIFYEDENGTERYVHPEDVKTCPQCLQITIYPAIKDEEVCLEKWPNCVYCYNNKITDECSRL